MLNDIHFSSRKVINLLQNLLDWAKSQNNSVSIHFEQIILQDIIQEEINLLETQAKNKMINFNLNYENINSICADKNMIHTIVRNLISNAIKFSHIHSTIDISLTNDNDRFFLTVKDYGIGMNEKVIKSLFQIDKTIKSKGTSNESGTGLGLIICKEFITKNNG